MSIASKRFAISLALLASLFLSSVTFAAQEQKAAIAPTRDWSLLNSVASGSKLVIKLKSGKTVEGKLSGVSDAALSLSVKGKPVALSRDEVLSVYQIKGKSAKRSTLIGLGVGAGTGAVIGAVGGDDGFGPTRAQWAAGLSVLGGAAGALTGFVIGKTRHKRMLIYEAK